jgi:hypothetical protein
MCFKGGIMRRIAFLAAALIMAPVGVRADELADLKAQLAAATKSLQALQNRVDALEAEKAKTGPAKKTALPAPAIVKAVPAAQPVTVAGPPVIAPNEKPEKPITLSLGQTGGRLEISGAVQLDAIYDAKRTDPNWEGTLRPSKIPVVCPGDPGCGKNGVTNFNVRQTNFDLKGFLPIDSTELKTEFAFDLWGGADTGEVRMRLTKAWGSFGPWLFGYNDSLFMDIDVFPNTIDFWGPSGMMFLRDPQVRVTPYNQGGVTLAVAAEVPGAGIDEGHAIEIDPNLGVVPKSHYPDITAQLRWDGTWGHVQLAGVARWVGFDNPPGINAEPSGNLFGGGVNLTAAIKTIGDDAIKGQVAYGKPIAAYSNDCCVDLAASGTGTGQAVTLPLFNWLVYYDHWWSKQWSSSIGYSENFQQNSLGQLNTAQHIGRYASVNVLYYPYQNVTLGLEGLWGERVNKDGSSGQDQRAQFSAKAKF